MTEAATQPAPRTLPSTPRHDGRVIAVMPAYNAGTTLERTVADIPAGSVDQVILVDDGSANPPIPCKSCVEML